MRWKLAAGAVAAIVAVFAVYTLLFSSTSVAPTITIGFATSQIGEGDSAIGVTPGGEVLRDQPPPEEGTLPSLPGQPPKGGQLSGPMLAQAKVLGAAPQPLRPCISHSFYGDSGVDVELSSGIEIRFGDSTRAEEKWSSAIALLADPSITALDYVNVAAPTRPVTGGSGHSLPSPEEGSGDSCGA